MVPVEIPPYVLLLPGIWQDSNIYLVRSEDEALLIDTGTGMFIGQYLPFLMERLSGVERLTILNTHEHYDHTGGNLRMKAALEKRGITVRFAAHELTAEAIEKANDRIILAFHYGRSFEPHAVEVKFTGGEGLRVGSLSFEVLHTPGHTRGSIMLYDREEKLLFTGDTIFEGTIGRVDFPTGSLGEMLGTLNRLLDLDVDLGLPGHGKVILNWDENLRKVLKLTEGLL
ncbi:MBL fold metallo-hydrolase [Palaeococcus ferrophilus]|uniref:MBL fold metallo-hydrolase n=1 Tax=Palaeococcus ferrophilus TaxID=83868 RepID=UPI00064FB6C4|nr:MBL fold metallo-hydrolase [Palaeococcus ferrophilus]